MAIEGISSAVNSTNVQVKQTNKVSVEPQAVTTAGNLKIEPIKAVETKGDSDFKSWDDKESDRGQVQSDKEISPEKVKSAVDDINKQIKSSMKHTSLSFKYHDETNRISITVTDSETNEVIREIPPEKALDMVAKAWEMAGLLVDEKR